MAIKRSNLAVNQNALPVIMLPEREAALFDEMIQSWKRYRRGSLRHTQNPVEASCAVVMDMLEYVGKAPWYWTEQDFDMWCEYLGLERKLAISTQRKYQTALRLFFSYIVDNLKFRNEVRRSYGFELQKIITRENCLPHNVEKELAKEKPALSHDQIQTLFDSIDIGIKEAALFHSKEFRPLQRDKVFFYILYIAGLRISEGLGLTLNSFEPNPDFPEFGIYGYIHVWGKGSNGSGPKHRIVPVTHPELPILLDWYVKNIYPEFLINADANETALFLSERGNRLSRSTAEARFQRVLDLAGLTGKGFTPHSLRHSSVSHESLRLSQEANRRKHGHKYGTTTQIYTHLGDEVIREEITEVVSSQLDRLLDQRKKENEK